MREQYDKAVKNSDGTLKNILLTIDGEKFRCECGCNVFHKPDKSDLEKYRCNNCDTDYRGE